MTKFINLIFALGLTALFIIPAGMPQSAKAEDTTTIWAGPPSQHAVALTFDDGPSPLYTPQVLNLLKEYQAHATFFVLGRKVEEYPLLVKQMLKEGHEVGNHSFSHPRLTVTDQPTRERELESTGLGLDLLGCPREHKLIRPPYSAFDDRLVSYAAHTGRHLVMWNIDSGDWRGLNSQTIAKNVLSRMRNGSIVVMHDSDENDQADRQPTVEALKTILSALQAENYRLVTISEMMTGGTTLARHSRGPAAKVH